MNRRTARTRERNFLTISSSFHTFGPAFLWIVGTSWCTSSARVTSWSDTHRWTNLSINRAGIRQANRSGSKRIFLKEKSSWAHVHEFEGNHDPLVRSQPPIADRFHDDMRRVLLSRRHNLDNLLDASVERRGRPIILESDLDGAQRALTMLNHLIQIDAANEESYQIVMQAFVNRGRLRWHNASNVVICAADQVELLLESLLRRGQDSSAISIGTYNFVLQAYAICSTPRGDRGYANRACDLLQQLRNIFPPDLLLDSHVHVLHAYAWQQANLHSGECALQASKLLRTVSERTTDSTVLMRCYGWVLEAWSKSSDRGSAEKADALFEKMKELNEAAVGHHLDIETYCNAILAWAKTNGELGAVRSHEILVEMSDLVATRSILLKGDSLLVAFNGVISAWARLGRADKAEQILRLMNHLRNTYQNIEPDSTSYNTILYAHLKSPDKEVALGRALEIVQQMEKISAKKPGLKPNSFTYNTLMKCWIQSGRDDLAQQAEALLVKMERLWEQGDSSVKPSNRIFNMIINAYAKSKDKFAARKARGILERMKASLDEKCQPDVISYTSVIECLSKSGDPDAPAQADALLAEASMRYRQSANRSDMPNSRTFTMTIQTFAKSNGCVIRARALLSQLVDLFEQTQDPNLKPNEYSYNYVLNCAANTLDESKKTEAFKIATQTYSEMRNSKHLSPDSFTYAFWIKCCNNLLPAGHLRTQCISYSFEECKKSGLVTKEILARLSQGLSPAILSELLDLSMPTGGTETRYRMFVNVRDLPPNWSRNVRNHG